MGLSKLPQARQGAVGEKAPLPAGPPELARPVGVQGRARHDGVGDPTGRAAGRPQARPLSVYRPVSAELAITPTVSVVIPAMNEAANIPHVFATLPRWVNEVVLVDGRSTDGTVAVARAIRPETTIVCQPGFGKGDALLAGFAACRCDIIVTIDGDGSTDGREIVQFVSALVAGADFAKGSRFASAGRSDDITLTRRCGNRLLNVLVNRMFGTHYTDLCYGFNAFWARYLGAMAVDCPGFEVETLMSIRAAKAGLVIQEIPSYERPRLYGSSNLSAIRDGCRILRVILREKIRHGRCRDEARDPISRLSPGTSAIEVIAGPDRESL